MSQIWVLPVYLIALSLGGYISATKWLKNSPVKRITIFPLQSLYDGRLLVYQVIYHLDSCSNITSACSFRSRYISITIAATLFIFHADRTSCWSSFLSSFSVTASHAGYVRWANEANTDCPGSLDSRFKKNQPSICLISDSFLVPPNPHSTLLLSLLFTLSLCIWGFWCTQTWTKQYW